MLISFFDLARRGGRGGVLLMLTGVDLGRTFFFKLPLGGEVHIVNFEEILFLIMLVFWSVNKASHLDA